MSDTRSYNDPLSPHTEVHIENEWVSDEAYVEVAQKCIVPCTDVVFFDSKNKVVYFAKRNVFPQRHIWCFGGRRLFNDKTPKHSIQRAVKRETGLEIDLERFIYLYDNDYSWVKVAQGDFPGKSTVKVFVCEVSEDEVAQMTKGLSPTEYDQNFGIQKFDRNRMVSDNVHPAMQDIYDQLFPA